MKRTTSKFKRRDEPVPDTGFIPLFGNFNFNSDVELDPLPDDDKLARKLHSFEQFYRDSEKMADY